MALSLLAFVAIQCVVLYTVQNCIVKLFHYILLAMRHESESWKSTASNVAGLHEMTKQAFINICLLSDQVAF